MQRLNDKDFLMYLKNKFNAIPNEGQAESILTVFGAILLIAVPGGGKTWACCNRIFNMIWNHGIDPKKILAVTFSKASARDMKTKFNEMFQEVLEKDIPNYIEKPMDFSTIHAFSYRIIRDYQKLTGKYFNLIENSQSNGNNKRKCFEEIYFKICNDTITDDVYEEITKQISYCKNRLMSISDIKVYARSGEVHKKFYELYIEYDDYKKNNDYIDYDDMLTLSLEYLNNNQQIYEKYSNMYDFIVVDEGQDTSTVQFEIILKITGKDENICCIGDDDQTLYEWRSADVNNFLYFDKYFPSVKKIFMEQNYRSTGKIIEVSNEFIKHNEKRYDKNLFTKNELGDNIEIVECDTYTDQMEYVAQKIQKINNYKDCAILFRNNVSAFTMSNVLKKYNIPFYIRDYKESFFSHWMLKDISNFINVAINPKDVHSFSKIALKMNRYLSKQMIYFITKHKNDDLDVFDKLLEVPDLKRYQKDSFLTLKQEFLRLKNKNIQSAIDYICNDFNYLDYLENRSKKFGSSLESLKERLFIIKEISSSYSDLHEFSENINKFQNDLDNSKCNYGKNVVTLTTDHSSKGLEWKNVFMIDLNDGIFPSYQEIAKEKEGDKSLMEASRRVFYVGMTRGKVKLFLIHSKERNGSSVKASRFTLEVLKICKEKKYCDLKSFAIHQNSNKVSLFNINQEKYIKDLEGHISKYDEKITSSTQQTSLFFNCSQSKNTNSNTNHKIKEPYSVGNKVKHKNLGEGIIIKKTDAFIEVKLLAGELKKLNLDMCLRNDLLDDLG